MKLSKTAYIALLAPEAEVIQWMALKADEFKKMTGEDLANPKEVLNMIRFAAMIQFDCEDEEELYRVLRAKLKIEEKR